MKVRLFTLVVLLIVAFTAVVGGTYYFLNGQDENSLNITEKEWIETNKNQLHDFSILSSIPVFTYDGDGIIFEFLDSLEKDTGLDFGELSYAYGEKPTSEYAFKVVDKKSKDDILLYQDNYVLVTKDKKTFNTTSDIKDMNIGVVTEKLENIQKYLVGSTKVNYVTVENESDLLTFTDVDAIVLPKIIYMKSLAGDDKLNIAYNITEMTNDYVISLGSDEILNSILKKYYKVWEKENFKQTFKEKFSNDYFVFNNVSEKDKAAFIGKRYKYGFVNNLPFDTIIDKEFVGINTEFLKSFATATGIEIEFKEYDDIDALVKAINNKEIDFYYNNGKDVKYSVETYQTASHINEQVNILSSNENDVTINTLASLNGMEVCAIKSSLIAETLASNGVKVKEFKTIEDLVNNVTKDDIIAIDLENYIYYSSKLKKFKLDYQFTLDKSYNFVTLDTNENKVFNRFFDFYLNFVNQTEIINDAHINIDKVLNKPSILKIIILSISTLIILSLSIFGIFQITKKDKKQKTIVVKGDKIKYIDILTSLKNRNYLYDKMEEWDNSEIYPQAIVIVDLNNLNYINDNYGHKIGDNLIKQTASILIKTQMDNSEIIRTNGDEFLIYLVGYTEKQIVTYIRKLHKEFKELEYGFGVASGYSMIINAIKTIDDAINEATADMKSNKEEIKSQNN